MDLISIIAHPKRKVNCQHKHQVHDCIGGWHFDDAAWDDLHEYYFCLDCVREIKHHGKCHFDRISFTRMCRRDLRRYLDQQNKAKVTRLLNRDVFYRDALGRKARFHVVEVGSGQVYGSTTWGLWFWLPMDQITQIGDRNE
jgi:hypothetical protein